jgi:hypothetical protein
VIADTFGLSQPSVSRAISDVSTALVKRAGNYITFPKEPKLSEIKGNCYSRKISTPRTLSYLVSRLDS